MKRAYFARVSFAVDHVEKTCLVPETAPDIRLFFGKGECQPISWGNLMLNHRMFARHTDTTSPTFQPLPLMLANSWPSRRPHRMTQNQRAKIQDPNLTPRRVKHVGIAKLDPSGGYVIIISSFTMDNLVGGFNHLEKYDFVSWDYCSQLNGK